MWPLVVFVVIVLALVFGGEWLARRLKAEAKKIDAAVDAAFSQFDQE